jgi:hypothetical protein
LSQIPAVRRYSNQSTLWKNDFVFFYNFTTFFLVTY